jgi:hypothetical protein
VPVSLDDIVEQLQRSRSDTLEAIELLRSSRQQIEEHAKQLEGPRAALEYIDFFLDFFTGAVADLERVCAELPRGLTGAHLEVLRQIASNASIEQRRCLLFRDRWINKPLPDERMRPLLNQLSTDSRDQIAAYRSLNNAAAGLQALAGLDERSADDRKLDRRALFTRWFGR